MRFFIEGQCNFGRSVLIDIASANDYGIYRLSREQEGECGHARALLEMLSIMASSRLCDTFWRLGPGVDDADASSGHWVGATHIHADGDWLTHESFIVKNSIKSFSRSITAENAMTFLGDSEKQRLNWPHC